MYNEEEFAEAAFKERVRKAKDSPAIDFIAESQPAVLEEKAVRMLKEKQDYLARMEAWLEAEKQRLKLALEQKRLSSLDFDQEVQALKFPEATDPVAYDDIVRINGLSDQKNGNIIEFATRSEYFADELMRLSKDYMNRGGVSFDWSSTTAYYLKFDDRKAYEEALGQISQLYGKMGYVSDRPEHVIMGSDLASKGSERFISQFEVTFSLPKTYLSEIGEESSPLVKSSSSS